MTRGAKPALEATVLRGIALSGEPRVLAPRSSHQDGHEAGHTRVPGEPDLAVDAKPASSFDAVLHDALEAARARGLQEGLAEGKRRGFDQGLAEGRESAAREAALQVEAAKEALAERVERLDAWLLGLSEAWDRHLAEHLSAVEEDMVALSAAAALRILGPRALDRETTLHGVRQAVSQCRDAGEGARVMAIHVHPQDLEFLSTDPGLAEWFRNRDLPSVKWIADGAIRLGGCTVRSNQGTLDARLETQFSSLQGMLARMRQERVSGPAGRGLAEAGEA